MMENVSPFNLAALLIFVLAIVHIFLANRILLVANRLEKEDRSRKGYFTAKLLHFLGEVEIVFAIWLVPLFIVMSSLCGWSSLTEYLNSRHYEEPIFIFVIMVICSSKPTLHLVERIFDLFLGFVKDTIATRWVIVLTIGPLLGSFVTEPAAMTICAILLGTQFYEYKPSLPLAYSTLGLLFVNISVGGVMTHFAAPAVLMVARPWGWDTPYMFLNFGFKAIIGIVIANVVYLLLFRREFSRMQRRASTKQRASPSSSPIWVSLVHAILIVCVVLTAQVPVFCFSVFLLFLAFCQITARYQSSLVLKTPLLVGIFLASLVIHGGLQGWWIEPLLLRMNDHWMMVSSLILSAMNDNAVVTYLASLLPTISVDMKHAVILGAILGGGLTVIGNAPNPAGLLILQKHFEKGVSPGYLFLGALIPMLITFAVFSLL